MGYPSLRRTIEIANEYVNSGCDTIEIDLPAKDPYMENELISSRMESALNHEPSYDQYLETLSAIRKNHPDTAFIVLVYERTIKEIGPDKFVDFLKKEDALDVIYVGSEFPEIRKKLMNNGVRISSFVPFDLDREHVEVAKSTNGFVYMQAKSTGDVNPDYPTLRSCINYLREEAKIRRPIYAGVGIRDESDISTVKEAGADGAFVGSTVLKLHNDIPKLKQTIKKLKSNT